MSKGERRTLIAEVYRRACAGCERSIQRLRELTRKRGQARFTSCEVCGAACRTYQLDGIGARCHMHRKHMLSMRERERKLLAGAAALVLCLASYGADVRLAWDASPTEGVTNYVLYAWTNAITQENYTNALVKVSVGTNLTATVRNPIPVRWWFAATAMKDGLESDLSNVIDVELPLKPTRMRALVIEHSQNTTNWQGIATVVLEYSDTLTNWTDIGFFRLRIP